MNKINKQAAHICSIAVIAVLVLLDQLTKAAAVACLKGSSGIDLLEGVLRLQYLENRGAAFGILQNQQWIFLLLGVCFLVVACYIYIRIPYTKRMLPLRIVLLFLAAGAVGNMIDRALHSYVVDFIYFCLINFPIFNVADIYVTCSVIVFVLLVLFYYKEDELSFFGSKRERP